MKESFIIAKLLSTYLYDTYHIRISAKQILSIGKDYTLPDDIYEYVKLGYEWLEKVYKNLIIFDGAHTSDKVISEIMQVLKEEGTFEEGHYTPNNPEQTVLAVIDHAGLLVPANGRTKKGEIDECANKLVVVRNKTDLSVLFIMQSNRSVANMDRKKNEAFMEPMVEDIKETGTLTQYFYITFKNKIKELITPYMHYTLMYKLGVPKTPLNRVNLEQEQEVPVLNPLEIEEKAKRLEVTLN